MIVNGGVENLVDVAGLTLDGNLVIAANHLAHVLALGSLCSSDSL